MENDIIDYEIERLDRLTSIAFDFKIKKQKNWLQILMYNAKWWFTARKAKLENLDLAGIKKNHAINTGENYLTKKDLSELIIKLDADAQHTKMILERIMIKIDKISKK